MTLVLKTKLLESQDINVRANDCVALLSHTSHPQKLKKIEAAFPGIVK